MKGKKKTNARTRRLKSRIAVHSALASTAAFLVFAGLAFASPQTLVPLDAIGRTAVVPFQTFEWVQFFLVITALGGGVGVIVTALAFCTVTRLDPAQIVRLAAILTTVAVASRIVKAVTERARPEAVLWLEPLSSYSFPSAHAASGAALFGFIALYLYRRTGNIVLILVPVAIAFLIGMSRMVLGVHYLSDVLGGFLLGIAILAAGLVFPFEKIIKKYG